jgi:hypothetical protein
MDGWAKVIYALVIRTCRSEPARDGGVSGNDSGLTHRYREQAHSYSWILVCQELHWWLEWPLREQARSHRGKTGAVLGTAAGEVNQRPKRSRSE